MQELAETIVNLADVHGTIPVIVVPKELRLKPAFYVSLAACLREQIDANRRTDSIRRIRFDWLRQSVGLVGSLAAATDRHHLRRLNRILTRQSYDAEAMLTTLLSRPAGLQRTFVLGTASAGTVLPLWATEIEIGTTPVVDLARTA